MMMMMLIMTMIMMKWLVGKVKDAEGVEKTTDAN